ncbi:MAG: hypothetical protein ONB44_00875 [candidate division KSB1 bacterium]|nr:hypothetical protein [candidate division KSB1 bacterium]MDZ7300672.1 hypothetical protein [candidate division KSB1 bacterium]MDZ7309808.1 hypothetical protein [candidate division KSB1 bacterium]
MTIRIQILAGVALLLGSYGLARVGAGNESGPPGSPAGVVFTKAKVHFEQNATDGDVEVVFEAKGGKEGLVKLTVVSPDGRTVVDFTAPDASTLGMRQFRFESPEPKDVKSLKSAYPEGVYTFDGTTASGAKLHGQSTLSHKLPATTSFLHPQAGAQNVPIKNLKITWTPVKNLAAYIIYIEQDELDVNLTAKLPGSVATFDVPGGFLLSGTEYQLGIGTVTEEGNISFIETAFTTAEKE